MQNGPKTVMSRRQHKPAASFAARSKRWTWSAARPDSKDPQNAHIRAKNNEALSDGAWWAFFPAMGLITSIVLALYVLNTSLEGVFNPRLRK